MFAIAFYRRGAEALRYRECFHPLCPEDFSRRDYLAPRTLGTPSFRTVLRTLVPKRVKKTLRSLREVFSQVFGILADRDIGDVGTSEKKMKVRINSSPWCILTMFVMVVFIMPLNFSVCYADENSDEREANESTKTSELNQEAEEKAQKEGKTYQEAMQEIAQQRFADQANSLPSSQGDFRALENSSMSGTPNGGFDAPGIADGGVSPQVGDGIDPNVRTMTPEQVSQQLNSPESVAQQQALNESQAAPQQATAAQDPNATQSSLSKAAQTEPPPSQQPQQGEFARNSSPPTGSNGSDVVSTSPNPGQASSQPIQQALNGSETPSPITQASPTQITQAPTGGYNASTMPATSGGVGSTGGTQLTSANPGEGLGGSQTNYSPTGSSTGGPGSPPETGGPAALGRGIFNPGSLTSAGGNGGAGATSAAPTQVASVAAGPTSPYAGMFNPNGVSQTSPLSSSGGGVTLPSDPGSALASLKNSWSNASAANAAKASMNGSSSTPSVLPDASYHPDGEKSILSSQAGADGISENPFAIGAMVPGVAGSTPNILPGGAVENSVDGTTTAGAAVDGKFVDDPMGVSAGVTEKKVSFWDKLKSFFGFGKKEKGAPSIKLDMGMEQSIVIRCRENVPFEVTLTDADKVMISAKQAVDVKGGDGVVMVVSDETVFNAGGKGKRIKIYSHGKNEIVITNIGKMPAKVMVTRISGTDPEQDICISVINADGGQKTVYLGVSRAKPLAEDRSGLWLMILLALVLGGSAGYVLRNKESRAQFVSTVQAKWAAFMEWARRVWYLAYSRMFVAQPKRVL